jgi:hypothetical protein
MLLSTTPRSLDIPTSHGGLGNAFDKKSTRNDRLSYLFDLFNKRDKQIISNKFLPEGYVWHSYPRLKSTDEVSDGEILNIWKRKQYLIDNDSILDVNDLRKSLLTWDSLESMTDTKSIIPLNFRQLGSFWKRIRKNERIREFVRSGILEQMPSLSQIQYQTIIVRSDFISKHNMIDDLILTA